VVQDHASGAPDARSWWPKRALVRSALRGVDAFFFVADTQADPWRHAGLIGPDQLVYEVLESSTAIRPTHRDAATKHSGVSGQPAVLWVGRLNANKDPLTVLDGFEAALASLPHARLTMVFAEDDLLPAVEARLARSATLRASVGLVGRVPHEHMPDYFSAADLFVLGSHHEGSGYALIEALACGAVPVVTDIPSFRKITDNGAVGSLWAAGHPGRLAETLVATAARVAELRPRALAHFEVALRWDAVGRRAMAAYEDVVSRRHAGNGARPLRRRNS
jgi:glycosyltransferase involved in cell wall biosynthesis